MLSDRKRLSTRLWIGSYPEADSRPSALGIDAVVLCAMEWQPAIRTDFVLHVPLDDGSLPPHEIVIANRAANAVAQLLATGRTVLVTCWQGRNRSGLVAALALRRRYGLTGREARVGVQKHRQNALTNPDFARYLDQLPVPAYVVK